MMMSRISAREIALGSGFQALVVLGVGDLRIGWGAGRASAGRAVA
ncbi:hypothetical protein [Methylopila turkensis]|nr:hypothetical protein [Methylopila turkensis]